MGYDASSGNVVMFASADSIWTWNGTTWAELPAPATTPPAATRQSMAYDADTGGAVLFGGLTTTQWPPATLHSTWTWDGTNWAREPAATHPPGRQAAEMTYDGATGSVLLFSGRRTSGGLLDDTWSWG
jgi:hypothetical protein